jgi:transcriptional regulator with XRE-family HTH domain
MDSQKYNHLLEQFDKRFKQLRKEKGQTLLDIEVATGINNGDISRIENGRTNIEFITIAKLAEALDIEMFELFHFETSISKKEKGNVPAKRAIKKRK